MNNFRSKNTYGPRRNSNRNDYGRPRFEGRDDGRAELHPATCASCGTECMVPFRPNGRKPVLCKQCFKKDHDGAEPRRPQARAFKHSNFERDAQVSTAKNPQLEAIERKLDKVIKMLSGTYTGPAQTEKPKKEKKAKMQSPKEDFTPVQINEPVSQPEIEEVSVVQEG